MEIVGGNNVVVLNYFVKLPYKISVEISLRIPEPFLKKIWEEISEEPVIWSLGSLDQTNLIKKATFETRPVDYNKIVSQLFQDLLQIAFFVLLEALWDDGEKSEHN